MVMTDGGAPALVMTDGGAPALVMTDGGAPAAWVIGELAPPTSAGAFGGNRTAITSANVSSTPNTRVGRENMKGRRCRSLCGERRWSGE